MGKFLEFDYKELKEFQKELKGLMDEGDQFLHQAITNIAQRAIAKIKRRTPVDTGTLRNAWRVAEIKKLGNQYIAIITNDTDYAEYVEYGHRVNTKGGGQRTPKVQIQAGKKKKYTVKKTQWKAKVENGFVKGRFMMTISMWEIEKEMGKIVEREFEKWLKARLEK